MKTIRLERVTLHEDPDGLAIPPTSAVRFTMTDKDGGKVADVPFHLEEIADFFRDVNAMPVEISLFEKGDV